MKILVFQSRIGVGSLNWDKHKDSVLTLNNIIIEKCIKSVKNWADKNNYEYILEKNNLNWKYTFNSKNDVVLNNALQNWDHLPKKGYDYIIYMDNDVFIRNAKIKIPLDDFMMCERMGDPFYFLRYYYGPKAKWWNAGVIIMSQKRCKHLCEWMLKTIPNARDIELFKDLPREESLIATYCKDYQPKKLSKKYNTIPTQTPTPLYKNSKIIHFTGSNKFEIVMKCPLEIQIELFKDNIVDYDLNKLKFSV